MTRLVHGGYVGLSGSTESHLIASYSRAINERPQAFNNGKFKGINFNLIYCIINAWLRWQPVVGLLLGPSIPQGTPSNAKYTLLMTRSKTRFWTWPTPKMTIDDLEVLSMLIQSQPIGRTHGNTLESPLNTSNTHSSLGLKITFLKWTRQKSMH